MKVNILPILIFLFYYSGTIVLPAHCMRCEAFCVRVRAGGFINN